MIVLLLALLSAPALADPEDVLDPVTLSIWREGRRLEGQGDLDGAARRYRTVHRTQPTFTHALLDLGRVQEAMEDWEGAEATYQASGDEDAMQALGLLYLRQERWDDAADVFHRMSRTYPGVPDAARYHAIALAHADPVAAIARYQQYLGYFPLDVQAAEAGATVHELADALVAAGFREEARGLLEQVRADLDLPDDAPEDPLLVELQVEDEAVRLARAGTKPLTQPQRERLVAAREAFAAGDVATARRQLDVLTTEAPRNPDAWAALADVALATGDVATADTALQRAEALAPYEARFPARLGDLLATGYAGRFDEDAAQAYARALRLDPTRAELWCSKAVVEQRIPEHAAQALAAARRCVEQAPGDPAAPALAEVLAGAARERPPPPELPEGTGCPATVSAEACTQFWIAMAWWRRNEPEQALAALALARAHDPTYARAIDLEASIVLERGDIDGAIRLYEASLAVEPDQDIPYVQLWKLYEAKGDAAAAATWLERAVERGAPEAHYFLAREAADRWDLPGARAQLDAFFGAQSSGPFYDDAVALSDLVDRRIRAVKLAGGAGAVSLFLAVPGVWWWRRSGADLETLLKRHPEAFRDVARVGSSIRHEVLKHNTTVLGAAADALRDGDPEPARWAAERLYGPRGAVARFREHVRALERVGRVHGVRLNLRRDAVFGPLIAAMDQLARMRRRLERGAPRAANELAGVATQLNHASYRALGRLLRRLCLLPVDAGLLHDAWDDVRRELGRVPECDVGVPPPVHVRAFQGDVHDVLVNLLRNAAAATPEGGRMALRAELEADPVTGLERIALRVCDDAPRRLTTAMIRSRYIERGLGLTVDLISRIGGSIHVEDEPGFAKAVVVRLPVAEAPEEDG